MIALENGDEIWKPIPQSADYHVSNWGRFKRVTPDKRNHAPKLIAGHIGNHGYTVVGINADGRNKKYLLHRIVCEVFHGPAPTAAHEVAHNDGSRTNHRADNLRWATRKENMADCVEHGSKAMGKKHGRTTKPLQTPRGEKHGHAKLTSQDIEMIRAASAFNGSGRKLAEWFGVSTATISLIRNNKIWTHI